MTSYKFNICVRKLIIEDVLIEANSARLPDLKVDGEEIKMALEYLLQTSARCIDIIEKNILVRVCEMPGLGPAAEASFDPAQDRLLFRQKDPKP